MKSHSKANMTTLDVIIPTARFGPRTDGLLSDLARELHPHRERVKRVVVVDDCAVSDVSPQLLRDGVAKVTAWPNDRNGPAVNRNRGARDSEADWLIFLDDDVRLTVGWGGQLVSLLDDNGGADLIGGRIGSQRPRNWFSQAAEDFVVRHRQYPEGWYLAAAHLLVRHEAFDSLGGFNETFKYGGEDWDFSQRAHALGLSVTVNDDISVLHANATTWPELALKARQYGTANGDLDHEALQTTGEAPAGSGGKLPNPSRAVGWLSSEYQLLRRQGRSRVRSARTMAIYVPWMVAYLRAQRKST